MESATNKYNLPTAVYNRTIWLIRDYYRMTQELDDILLHSPATFDDKPSSKSLSSGVEIAVEHREYLLRFTNTIEAAFKNIPAEYRRGVFNNIYYQDPFPQDAARSTYARWKTKIIYDIANALLFV